MIAVDTNVLLRYLLGDDPDQSERADKLIMGKDLVLVTDVVLVETLWTLAGSKYRLGQTELVGVIRALFRESNIRFEDGQVVWMALNDYRKAKPVRGKVADFADAIIIYKAKYIAASLNSSFDGSYTFDKAAQVLPGVKALV